MLSQTILVVVISIILAVSPPGHLIKLPPTVMWTLFGSNFCGLKLTAMCAYVSGLSSAYIFTIWAWSVTKMQFLPLVFVFCGPGPCAQFLLRIMFAMSLRFKGWRQVQASCIGWWFLLYLGAPLLRRVDWCLHRESSLALHILSGYGPRSLLVSIFFLGCTIPLSQYINCLLGCYGVVGKRENVVWVGDVSERQGYVALTQGWVVATFLY